MCVIGRRSMPESTPWVDQFAVQNSESVLLAWWQDRKGTHCKDTWVWDIKTILGSQLKEAEEDMQWRKRSLPESNLNGFFGTCAWISVGVEKGAQVCVCVLTWWQRERNQDYYRRRGIPRIIGLRVYKNQPTGLGFHWACIHVYTCIQKCRIRMKRIILVIHNLLSVTL